MHGKQRSPRDTGQAISEENVDRFLEGVEAFNRGDVERWLAIYHPDAVVEPQIAAVEGDYSGLDDLRRLFADIAGSWEVFEFHFSDLRDLGDRVLALGTFRSIGKESGVEQEISAAFLVTYRDGLCTHMKDYGEWAEALEAAGLQE